LFKNAFIRSSIYKTSTVQIYSAHFLYTVQLQLTFTYYIQCCVTSSKNVKVIVIKQLQTLISPVSMCREEQLKGRDSFIRNGVIQWSNCRKI